ncbi:hypothetical protein CLIB1444_01S16622 [[Candida] jaroonii]|uniref:Uncharacterized protein n=1 Tax=[Candida] jaroonii TaxID=467808 RepID=A0ACA9Y1W0_9ASCO|nr:hypothetical protein CLIB1444_01S16622 [[Candida] jaroonii]
MDKDTRTILLPKGTTEYDLVELPDYQDITKTRKYGKVGDSIYELKSIKESPKSIIFESGYVMENSEIILSSKINPTYLLISCLFDFQKYISLDDITDKFPWIEHIDEKYLLEITDKIDENGDSFYKISKPKVTDYLKKRIEAVQKTLDQTKLVNFMKMELYVNSESEVTDEIWALQLWSTSVNFVWDYLTISKYGDFVDSEKLNSHKAEVRNKLNINTMMTQQTTTKKEEKKKPVKKPVKKVAAGRGALDAFFKPK